MSKIALALAAGLLTVAAPAAAKVLDCPLRDAPFSKDSPLIDILLSPQASAVFEKHQPGMMAKVPPIMRSTQSPSLASILSPAVAMAMSGARDETQLAAIDADLRSLPVTAKDRALRCQRYDNERPHFVLPKDGAKIKVLLFEKMTGFRDTPSVEAADAMFRELATQNQWALVISNKAGIINSADLKKFDVVIWNNVSGDVLTLSQRRAFEEYIRGGGGYVGIHGSAGDFIYFWDWYPDALIGARFIGHSGDPQFQAARISLEPNPAKIGAGLAPSWTMTDEWYSFRQSPRASSQVVATLDESSYKPVGYGAQNLRMGDHPIAWTRCVGSGRSFYSAIGHKPETYSDLGHRQIVLDAVVWAAGKRATRCDGQRAR